MISAAHTLRCAVIAWLACTGAAFAQDLLIKMPLRSVSRSGQFITYCDDNALRLAVSGHAEEIKSGVLGLLGLSDEWKSPVVIRLAMPSSTGGAVAPSSLRVFQTEEGYKVQVDISLQGDLARARFNEQIVTALLLEVMHRKPGSIEAGKPYAEPPGWLVAGIVKWLRTHDRADEADVFRTVIGSGAPLPLREFLSQKAANLDSASAALFEACGMCLIQLLIDQPEGRQRLGDYVKSLATNHDEPLVALGRHFSVLAGNEISVEKWWTLNLAKLGAADRYRGLTVEETESRLEKLLVFLLDSAEGDQKEIVPLTDTERFLKNKSTRPMLKERARELLELASRGNALLRPVIMEYQTACLMLAQGRTKGVAERIEAAEILRGEVNQRVEDIADYLNWFEVTQVRTPSRLFETYIETARQMEAPSPRRDDAIAKYLDTMESVLE